LETLFLRIYLSTKARTQRYPNLIALFSRNQIIHSGYNPLVFFKGFTFAKGETFFTIRKGKTVLKTGVAELVQRLKIWDQVFPEGAI
jgi:hypothetical protein